MTHVVAVSTMTSVILLLLEMLLAMMLLMSLLLVLLRKVHLHVISLVAGPSVHHDMLSLLVPLIVHPEWIMSRRL